MRRPPPESGLGKAIGDRTAVTRPWNLLAGDGHGVCPSAPRVPDYRAMKLSRLGLIASIAVCFLAAPLAAEAQPPIRIGASLPQTGGLATVAQNQLRGYQLCVKHMNDKGGVLGRKLELVLYDDGSDPATAVRLYESSSPRTRWIWCSVRTARPSPTPWPT